MVIDDTTVIVGIAALSSAIVSMWLYYNSRIAKLEARISQVEKDRLKDYKEHLEKSQALTERCVKAMETMSMAVVDLKNELHKGKE